MYWIWATEPCGADESLFHVIPQAVEQLGLRFDEGRWIGDDIAPLVLELHETVRGTLTDNLLAPGVNGLVLSTRLRELLHALGVDSIQYFAFTLRSADGSESHEYRIANILGRVACLDRSQSKLVNELEAPDLIVAVESLVIDEERTQGFDLFRLHEESEVIIASDRLRRACRQSGITGVRFYRPQDFCF
jgi:hypothetical protein